MEDTHFLKKDWVGFIALIIVIVLVWFLVEHFELLDNIRSLSRREVSGFGLFAPLIFIISYVALIVALVPSAPLNIAAGILFGPTLGTLYSWIGVLLGGSISFLLSRKLGESFVARLLKEKSDILHNYNLRIENGGFETVLLFRMIPLFPIGGFNYLFGLTKIRFKSYLWASAIGIIPGVFILAYLGNSIQNPSFWNITITLLLLVIMGVVSFIYRKIKKPKENEK